MYEYLRMCPVGRDSLSRLGVSVSVVHGTVWEFSMQKFVYNSPQVLSGCDLLLASHVHHICNKQFFYVKGNFQYLRKIF